MARSNASAAQSQGRELRSGCSTPHGIAPSGAGDRCSSPVGMVAEGGAPYRGWPVVRLFGVGRCDLECRPQKTMACSTNTPQSLKCVGYFFLVECDAGCGAATPSNTSFAT